MARTRKRQSRSHSTVSIIDVARHSGTSVATVSRVLTNSTHAVAVGTRRKVQEAAVALGYQPNAIARALATQRTHTIGLIVGDITDPYFAEIARGVEDAARPDGYLTIICNSDRSPAAELAYFRMLLDHQVAVVIFAGGSITNTPESERLNEAVTAAVAAGRSVIALAEREFQGVPVITVDNRAITFDLTSFMIRQGHRRIAFVEGPNGLTTSSERRKGFEDAMLAAGLDATLIFPGGFGLESGRIAATAMQMQTLPDAVLAATDDTASGIVMALRVAGIAVPGQISVAGIDDSRYAQLLDLTTMKIPMYELGSLAVRPVINQQVHEMPPRTVLPHRLVVRSSTEQRMPGSG